MQITAHKSKFSMKFKSEQITLNIERKDKTFTILNVFFNSISRINFVQTDSRKELNAMLEQFEIMDDVGSLNNTVYRKIAENVDIKQGVFDVKVVIYNVDPTEKSTDTEVVDILVAASLGRIRFVFLMKFVNDFLAFLDPFSSAKEIVVEKANDALEGATKSVIDAYVNSTRVRFVKRHLIANLRTFKKKWIIRITKVAFNQCSV